MENLIPHNLLPIKRPLEDSNSPNEVYFYNEVIQPLIKDIVQMEANGIPIDLAKVAVLEDTVTNVLDEVYRKLANNELMLKFLRTVATQYKKDKAEELHRRIIELNEKSNHKYFGGIVVLDGGQWKINSSEKYFYVKGNLIGNGWKTLSWKPSE